MNGSGEAVAAGSLAMPGPYPGRVIEVHHPAAVVSGKVEPEAVRAMVQRGMCALTGAPEAPLSWRRLFEPGDIIGIKVNAVGRRYAISSHALVHAVAEGLQSAGVRAEDVLVFDRYRDQFIAAGYADNLPPGVRWDAATDSYDPVQLAIEGYDRDVYREVDLIAARFQDPKDERVRRSHVCLIATRKVNKIINLPVLKDHGFAGVTLALKNLSHGLVNNVRRSHASPATNACGTFIPAIVSLPIIRSKVVLHIVDATKALYEGGPFGGKATMWDHQTLYLATDPVALDRIGWDAIDAKRRQMRLPAVADVRASGEDDDDPAASGLRQPQHITLAGELGLGVFQRDRIRHERLDLGAEAWAK